VPAETDKLEAGIRAMGKLLDAHKDRLDKEFKAADKAAEAPGLADAVRAELDTAPLAKSAPVADTREIDLLDGKIAVLLARINKTARRAFRDLGNDTKVKEYRFHHLSRGGSRKGPIPTPTPTA
jgi:hypothetical protein